MLMQLAYAWMEETPTGDLDCILHTVNITQYQPTRLYQPTQTAPNDEPGPSLLSCTAE